VIDAEHTIIPVEPDEAFAAIKEFLDSLDPDGLGRLIHNAAEDLEGNGDELNGALENFSRLVDVFADHDEELVQILANFDDFTATLRTRESQLGTVLDTFAEATEVLAAERSSVEDLVANLARLSEDGFDLISEHAVELRRDIETLTRLASSIDANLDAVGQLLDSGPQLATGLQSAYNPTLRAMNLRNNFGPLAQELLNPTFRYLLGDPNFAFPCTEIPAVGGSQCPETAGGLPAPPATTPVDDVLGLFAVPTASMSSTGDTSWTDAIADGASSVGHFLSDAAGTLLGVGS
jgi:phospholipid/cholesterol/gamma-HCH transport system substrate-binding protein